MAITDNLIAYYKLDETSGNATDSTANAYTLTDRNTVGTGTGKINSGRVFVRASSEALSRSDNANLSAGNVDFAIQAWVKLTSKAGNMLFVGKWNYVGSSREYDLGYDSAADRFIFKISIDGASGGSVITATANAFGAPSTGVYYHLMAWHDATANTLNIVVNNGTVNSTSHSTGVFDGSSDFTIGGMYQSADDYADAAIDEVGFWRGRFPTSTERTSLYNGGSGLAYPLTTGPALFEQIVTVTTTPTKTIAKTILARKLYSSTVARNIVRAPLHVLLSTSPVTPIASIKKVVTLARLAQSTISATLGKVSSKTLAFPITPISAIRKIVQTVKNTSSTITSSRLLAPTRKLLTSVAHSAIIPRSVVAVRLIVVTPVITRVFTIVKSLHASVVSSANIIKGTAVELTIAASASIVASIHRNTVKNILVSQAISTSIIKFVSKLVNPVVSVIGSSKRLVITSLLTSITSITSSKRLTVIARMVQAAITASAHRNAIKYLTYVSTISTGIRRAYERILLAQPVINASVNRITSKVITAYTTIAMQVPKLVQKSVQVSVSSVASIIRGTELIVTIAVQAVSFPTIRRSVVKLVHLTTSPAMSIVRSLQRTITTVALSAPQAIKTLVRVLYTGIAPIVALRKAPSLVRLVSSVAQASKKKVVSKYIRASVTPLFSQYRAIAKTVSLIVSPLFSIAKRIAKQPISATVQGLARILFRVPVGLGVDDGSVAMFVDRATREFVSFVKSATRSFRGRNQ